VLYCWSRLVLSFVVLSFQVLLEHAAVWDVVEVVPGEVEVVALVANFWRCWLDDRLLAWLAADWLLLVRLSVVGLVGRRLVIVVRMRPSCRWACSWFLGRFWP
jgi:hypothetical protein